MSIINKTVLIFALCCAPFGISSVAAQPAQLLKDIMPGSAPADSDASGFVQMNGIAYYQGHHPATGYELWRTDGTEAGTWIVKDLLAGSQSSKPVNLTVSNGYLYFMAQASFDSYRLWRTDGTEAGTVELLKDSQYQQVTNFYISTEGKLYVEGINANHEHVLLATDGTAEDTTALAQLIFPILARPPGSWATPVRLRYM